VIRASNRSPARHVIVSTTLKTCGEGPSRDMVICVVAP
jgi:hypothetical protein